MSFAGKASSQRAKNAYIPVSDGKDVNVVMGRNTSEVWISDPRLLGFTLAKYKFVAKMLKGKARVLEIGCGDGFASRLVAKEVQWLHCLDFYEPHIGEAQKYVEPHTEARFVDADILDGPFGWHKYDAAYALDVLEHIDPEQETLFLSNICKSLMRDGVFICGMPSLESQKYASPANVRSHINCQSAQQLETTLRKYFHNVFSFGFNDEVLHTGYDQMRQYLMMLCTGVKE